MTNILPVGLGGLHWLVARYKLGELGFAPARQKFPSAHCGQCRWLPGGRHTCRLGGEIRLSSPGARLLLFTGLLGESTTFSAFGLETLLLYGAVSRGLRLHQYAGASVLLGVVAVSAWRRDRLRAALGRTLVQDHNVVMPEERKDDGGRQPYEPYVGRWSRLKPGFSAVAPVAGATRLVGRRMWNRRSYRAILQQMQPRSVTGIDPSAGFVDYARARISDPRIHIEVADAQSLPVEVGPL